MVLKQLHQKNARLKKNYLNKIKPDHFGPVPFVLVSIENNYSRSHSLLSDHFEKLTTVPLSQFDEIRSCCVPFHRNVFHS